MTTTAIANVEDAARGVPALSTEGFETAQRMAKALTSSSVVPKDYQGNIANVMVAMEYANRLGCSVLAVMQNLDVIHGRPSLRSTFLIGTVNASGRFTPIRFRFQGTEGKNDWGCRAVAVDRESGEECLGPLVTIQTATDEGWYGKTGSKWKTIPELMLMYRSGAWWTRVYCPELSLGLHTTDEMEDLRYPEPHRIKDLAEKLDATEIVSANGSSATDAQVGELADLRQKAVDAGALTPLEGEEFEVVIHDRNPEQVNRAIADIQKAIAKVGGVAS